MLLKCNRNTGLVSANAEDACIYKQDSESYKGWKSSTYCAGTNDKSNSNIPSSSYSHISADVPRVGKVGYSEVRKKQDNMKPGAGCIASLEKEFSSCSRDVQNSCTLDGYKLFGVDLQMHSDSREQLNGVFKIGDVETSNTRVSLTNQNFLMQKIIVSVEPVNLGIVMCGKLWCSKHAIHPKGFKSRVKFLSILDPPRICNYVSEVFDAGFLGPLFKVCRWHKLQSMVHFAKKYNANQFQRRPLSTECLWDRLLSEAFTNTSADKCWESVLERLNHETKKLRNQGEREPPPLELLQSINGHKMFGFLSPSIIQAIEALGPNHQCVEYLNHKEVVSESSDSGIDDCKLSHGSSNSLSDVKTRLLGPGSRKLEQDSRRHCDSFEEMKLVLEGLLKKASAEELSAMHKLFSSDVHQVESGESLMH
ncbi:hypothetical protein VNO80_06488 [Phaseolus coccineus]|uniref:Uncharacterized protein n=1 Tax=Phaseolus coccineus TaxID=3886 RepID=A0AAN9NI38_PHACN